MNIESNSNFALIMLKTNKQFIFQFWPFFLSAICSWFGENSKFGNLLSLLIRAICLKIKQIEHCEASHHQTCHYFCDKTNHNKKETINYVEKENSSKRYNNLQSKHKNLSFLPIMLWNWNCHYQYLMGEKNLKYLNQKFINVSTNSWTVE